MKRVLLKRLPRDLAAGFGRYLALIFMIALGIYLVSSMVGAAETVLHGAVVKRAEFNTEDGFFTVFVPLTEEEIGKISEGGTRIEAEFYTDLKVTASSDPSDVTKASTSASSGTSGDEDTSDEDTSGEDTSDEDTSSEDTSDEDTSSEDTSGKLRMFKVREEIDKVLLDEGRLPEREWECAIEKRYAKCNQIAVGDIVHAGGFDFTVTGIGCVPDYDQPKAAFSDTAVESSSFGLIFVTEACYDAVRESGDCPAEEYVYAYRLGEGISPEDLKDRIKELPFDHQQVDNPYFREMMDRLLKDRTDLEDGIGELKDGSSELSGGLSELLDRVFDPDVRNLTSFVEAKDNERIEGAAGDVLMNRNAGLVAGVIVLILFGYVISVFVVHRIEQESPVIGTLYALGLKKGDLLLHYIALPTLLALLGGVIGVALGLTPFGIRMQLQETYNYFSVPDYDLYLPGYLWAYGIILPPMISGVVNVLVINGKMNRTALSLIRNEQKEGAVRRFSIQTKSFPLLFAIRQLVREGRSAVTILLGLVVSLMVIMLGLDCFVLCNGVKTSTEEDTRYEAMYLYKYPEEHALGGGECSYVETLRTDCMGYTLDVMVIGLEEGESAFFDARPEKGLSKAVINNSLAERYGYGIGDTVSFSDPSGDQIYAFTVTGVTQYAPGFTIFMDLESMRELFGRDEDYYNAVLSDHELEIDPGRLYGVTKRSDVAKSAGVFVDQMFSLVVTLISAGSVILAMVMYLMMGVMIDRSSFGISLLKVFGYRPAQVNRLYLMGNFLLVAVGAIPCILVAKMIVDRIFPLFIPNVACTMRFTFPLWLYGGLYLAVLVLMLFCMLLLTGKLRKITPAEVLKNRE